MIGSDRPEGASTGDPRTPPCVSPRDRPRGAGTPSRRGVTPPTCEAGHWGSGVLRRSGTNETTPAPLGGRASNLARAPPGGGRRSEVLRRKVVRPCDFGEGVRAPAAVHA